MAKYFLPLHNPEEKMKTLEQGERTMRTMAQITEQIDKTIPSMNDGSQWPGMTYEEGVRAALEWVTGVSEELPMED